MWCSPHNLGLETVSLNLISGRSTSVTQTKVADSNPANIDAPVAGETCPKCHTTASWGSSSWCPECGYYPGITEGISEVVEVPTEETAPVEEPPLLEEWVIYSIAGPTTLFVFGIFAKWVFTYYGGPRGIISLILLLSGLAAFVYAHLRSTLATMQEKPDTTPFDTVANPIEMWRTTIRGLPETGGRISLGVSGLTAVVVALLVIGGIDLNSLLEREKVKQKGPGIIKRMLIYMQRQQIEQAQGGEVAVAVA